MYRGGQWVLDVDVRKYFDSIDQAKLRELLARRVTDGVVRRLIDKWLKAGVLDNGQLSYPELGTPQGGVISPCLANVFLHYVLDEWFAAEVQPRLRGPSTLVRFADDFVVILAHKDDAERVLRVLGKRLGKYGLELHPDKTQMIDFRFKPQSGHDGHQEPLATTFNFLGFTHVWVTSEKGRAMVRQLTAKDRVARTLKAVSRVCRGMRTRPLRDQHQRLSRMLKGHYAYFGISGNFERLATLRNHVARIWRKWLSRRSNERSMPWVAFMRILTLFPLPQPRIVRRYAKP
jgi:group II intron reverse transcriptase/maturase